MTIQSTVNPSTGPETSTDLERLVASFDDHCPERTAVEQTLGGRTLGARPLGARTVGTPGARAFALPAGWTRGDPRHVEEVPVASLLGWTAPASVDTLVFVGGGRAARSEPTATAGIGRAEEADHLAGRTLSPGSPLPAVDVVVAVDRAGRLAGRVRIGDTVESRPPAGGRLFDALHRCLGLATAPPAESTARLLATLWLAAIAAAGTSSKGLLTWPETVRCHPIAVALIAEDPSIGEQGLEEAIVMVPRIWTWEALREATSDHGTLDLLCPAGLSGWMDEGMFSRWVSGSAVPLDQVVADAAAAVSASVWKWTAELLSRSGVVLPGSWC